jgi:hypothetical protein
MAQWRKQASLWRVTAACFIGLTASCVLLGVAVQLRERLVRSRSEALYAEFMKLRPGVTTQAEVDGIRNQWAGKAPENVFCDDGTCRYTIGSLWDLTHWFPLTRLIHDHSPTSEFVMETKADRLLEASFAAGVLVPRGYGTRAERELLRNPGYFPYSSGDFMLFGRAFLIPALSTDRSDGPIPMPASGYQIGGPSACTYCLAVFVRALPSVSEETRKQIFHFNFGCMTQWSVCTDKEDIMPVASKVD